MPKRDFSLEKGAPLPRPCQNGASACASNNLAEAQQKISINRQTANYIATKIAVFVLEHQMKRQQQLKDNFSMRNI